MSENEDSELERRYEEFRAAYFAFVEAETAAEQEACLHPYMLTEEYFDYLGGWAWENWQSGEKEAATVIQNLRFLLFACVAFGDVRRILEDFARQSDRPTP